MRLEEVPKVALSRRNRIPTHVDGAGKEVCSVALGKPLESLPGTALRHTLEAYVLLRHSPGLNPVQPLNARIKLFSLRKPTACATCLMGRWLRCKSAIARSWRT